MSWINNRESYVVKAPDLQHLIGDGLIDGLTRYHKWCAQLLFIRHASIAFFFFIFGIIGIYVINFPIYLFGLNNIDYLSLSGLWNVICMVSIFTVHLYFTSNNYRIIGTHDALQQPLLSHLTSWRALLPLITYPFCALCATSFYTKWIGLTSIHSLTAMPEDTTTTVIQYSVLALSYIYGYIPHQIGHRKLITFPSLQPNRSIFFKQILIRTFIANTIQSFTYCIVCLTLWCMLDGALSFSQWSILLRITLNLNYLWIVGHLLMNRILTEKQDMSKFNGAPYPLVNGTNANARCVDVRLLALTRSYSLQQAGDKTSERAYFCRLALLELLDVVRWDERQRKQIYATQIYYNIIVESLLADYTSFIIALYEFIYGDERKKMTPQKNTFLSVAWYKHFTLKPAMDAIFCDYQVLIHAADILSFLIVHSLEEDELGIVQESLEQILCVLLECLDILDIFLKNKLYTDVYGKSALNQKNEIIHGLYKGIENALMRIVVNMYTYLGALKLPKKNAQRLQSYIDH